jgi:8-oxo-dGTP pyrophosphatase MutT (NUDIX family)
VIDANLRLLLLKAVTPESGHIFWIAPGGGVDDGESFETTAARELHEETGLTALLGPWVWTRRHIYVWNGHEHDQYERFFVAHATECDFRPRLPDAYVTDHRWWTLPEIEAALDEFAPRRLRELLPPILSGDYPEVPLDCGV